MPAKLAVFGNPVEHSRSPDIHMAFSAQTGIPLHYEKRLAPIDGFAPAARTFIESGAHGFNVTVPFKRDAFALVDGCGDAAARAGVVNTVSVQSDGSLWGDNTDGAGLVADLEVNLGWRLENARILVLGAGGAVQGVLPALIGRGPARIDILNRTHEKALALAERFDVRAVRQDELDTGYDVIISGSSAGLSGDSVGPSARSVVGGMTRAYDMIYGAEATPFCRWATEAGAITASDGLGMLVEQAAEAFAIWFGVRPETKPVVAALRTITGGQ